MADIVNQGLATQNFEMEIGDKKTLHFNIYSKIVVEREREEYIAIEGSNSFIEPRQVKIIKELDVEKTPLDLTNASRITMFIQDTVKNPKYKMRVNVDFAYPGTDLSDGAFYITLQPAHTANLPEISSGYQYRVKAFYADGSKYTLAKGTITLLDSFGD